MFELLITILIFGLTIGILLWVAYLFIGDFAGAPFVPVSNRVMTATLTKMRLKKGTEFWDLGCGNGKVVFAAANNYGVRARGAEINPLLVIFCKLKSKWLNLKDTRFFAGNFFQCDLTKADSIYFYLYTGTVEKVAVKIEKECRSGTMVASRGFEIKRWKSRLIDVLITDGWKTYFYRV
jgi:hypothetical protein